MARPQYRVLRKIATVPVVASNFATVDLPRDYDYETIFLRIGGAIQVTTAATAVRAEAPCQSVPRVTVIADGKNNIFAAPFWFPCLAKYDRPLPESGARATTPPSAAGIATYQVEAIAAIDLMTVDGERTKDSNFRSSKLSLFQLQLQFGNAIDNFVPGAGVALFTTLAVDVFVQQLVEAPADDGSYTNPLALKKVSYQELALGASNANQEVRLPAGNLIKSVVLRGEGIVTAGEPGIGIFNNIQLAAGIDVRYNLSGPNARAKNNADTGQLTAGYYVADMTQKGHGPISLTELWDVTGAAEPKAVLDVVGGANVKMQAVVTEYIFARAA
jgi:hypothetical protein